MWRSYKNGPLKTLARKFKNDFGGKFIILSFKELERLINTDFSGRKRGGEGGSLLTVQIRSLLSRLDVLLEAMNDLKRMDGAASGGGGLDSPASLSSNRTGCDGSASQVVLMS